MKKGFAILLAIMLILTACSSDSSSKGDKSGFVPIDNLSLPLSGSEITDAAQINEDLFVIGGGKVYRTNLVSGESTALFDTDCTLMYAHDDLLHLFDAGKGSFLTVSPDGTEVDSISVDGLAASDSEAMLSFGVCDDFYVIRKKQLTSKAEVVVIDRKTKESATYSFTNGQGRFCSYKGNELLFISSDLAMDKYTVTRLDAETGKHKTLKTLDDIVICYDCQYDSAADTLSVIAQTTDNSVSMLQTEPSGENTKTVYKLGEIGAKNAGFFMAASSNITSIISSDGEYRYFDSDNPPDNISFVYLGDIAALADIIKSYEQETGVIVTMVQYSYDKVEQFNTKLMAEDIDFDCFYSKRLPVYVFPTSGKFVDLYDFDELKERIQSNPLAKKASEYDGKCFGLPVSLSCAPLNQGAFEGMSEKQIQDEKEFMEQAGIPYCDNPAATYRDYLIKNIDLAEGKYKDPKGKELYEVLCHLYEHPEDSADNAFYPQTDRMQTTPQYIILNPATPKKQLMAEFLTYIYDYINRDGSPTKYPEVTEDEAENAVISWKYNETEITMPILDAKNAVTRDKMGRTDIMNSPDPYKEIEKLAKKAAKEVAIRIEE